MSTLAQCIADRLPIYRFGSPELDRLHESARDPPLRVASRGEGWYFAGDAWSARRTYPVFHQVYGWAMHGFQYVVDHGGFYTLNRIERGRVAPSIEDLR